MWRVIFLHELFDNRQKNILPRKRQIVILVNQELMCTLE